jgi:hypothetical protein
MGLKFYTSVLEFAVKKTQEDQEEMKLKGIHQLLACADGVTLYHKEKHRSP